MPPTIAVRVIESILRIACVDVVETIGAIVSTEVADVIGVAQAPVVAEKLTRSIAVAAIPVMRILDIVVECKLKIPLKMKARIYAFNRYYFNF